MTLDPEFYEHLKAFDWFANCGSESSSADFPILWLPTKEDALASLGSSEWADVRTEAQGDLTGYLSKFHYSSYGGYWNSLAKQSRAKLEKELMPLLGERMEKLGLGDKALASVLLDLNRAALERAYQKRFANVPAFFAKLLTIYQRGHLPCGWEGQFRGGTTGKLLAY